MGGGVQELEPLRRKIADYQRMEQAYQSLTVEHEQLRKRLSDYEAKMALLSQEIQRLNDVLRGIMSERDQLSTRLQRLS